MNKGKCALQTLILRWGVNFAAMVCLVLLFLIFTNRELPIVSLGILDLQNFKILFLSIILEAFPFILLGVIVAALLHIFVSEDMVKRFVPKNPVLGILFACFLGVFFPLCECGMIPVVRRLILKGMPVYIGVVYILTGPILNPVVYASTFMAFRSRPEIAYSRMGLALVVAIIIGLILYRFVKSNPLRTQLERGHLHAHSHADHQHISGHVHHDHPAQDIAPHSHTPSHSDSHRHNNKAFATLGHASDEFFEMGKYLMFGAMLTALIQTFISRDNLVAIGDGQWSSHLFMMGFAYILSLCSTSDAFVASSFTTTFSAGSLVTFLVFGPMLDLKNTLMMFAVFRVKFVIMLTALIIIVVLLCSMLLERWILL